MKNLSGLLLLLIPMVASAEPPESIIGTWRLNLARTVAEHLQLGWSEPSNCWGTESASPDTASMTLEITEDTLTWSSNDVGPMTSRYRVIGGNAGLVIIEITDAEGYKSIANVHLVEGGLAAEVTNCEEQPEQCERERRRAMEHIRTTQSPGSDPFRVTDAGTVATMTDAGESNSEALAYPLRLVYFEPVAGER